MPTYDYECGGCGHGFEAFQGISEPHLKKCPQCKKPKLQRLFGGGAGFLFKGSGFYTTDYRSDSYKKGAKAAGKDTSSSSDSGKSGTTTSSSGKKASSTKKTT